jgi:hypothetical protein
VVVDDAVVSEFNEVKLGRVKAKFLIYKIDNTKIVKESMSPASASFNDLCTSFGELARVEVFLRTLPTCVSQVFHGGCPSFPPPPHSPFLPPSPPLL